MKDRYQGQDPAPKTPAERARDLYVELQEAVNHLRNIDAEFRKYAGYDPYGAMVKEYAGARNAQVARVTMLATLYQVERYIADNVGANLGDNVRL